MLGGRRPAFIRNVAPGVHRLAHAYVNCYIVEDGTAVTIVDAAFPQTWRYLPEALESVGRSLGDVEALVLTHAHFDHVGFAARAQQELDLRVLVHEGDRRLAAHPYRYARERSPLLYPLRYPRSLPIIAAMTSAGALAVPGVTGATIMPSSGALDVPGHPTVIATPGHTDGHCALHLPERDVVISGDALVTLDPYKGARGPQIIAGAATADSDLALASLERLRQTGARIVLPGHGEPWRHGIGAAVTAAQAAGAS
jgi:glyoxylase-like metal-dependent hydrolase (beta-lactamase superfamily II)